MVLEGRKDMDGEGGRECFRRCLNSLGYKRKKGEAGEEEKKGERERELENWWMSTKCTAPTSSTEPMFNNNFLYRENYYFLPCVPSHWDFCLRGAEFMNNEFILVMQAEMRESSIPVTIRDLNSCLNSKVAKLSSF